MILRRIREHAETHNWFAVAVEIAIVVVGVFLGIQASNWNDGRLERKQAHEYRAMLSSDLDTNITNLAGRKRYYLAVRSEALATLAALDQPSSTLGEKFLINAYQASQIQPWALKRNTYDQILSTGAMGKLGDPLIRDQIANYYVTSDVAAQNVGALPPYREIIRRIMPYKVQQGVRNRCPETVSFNERGEIRFAVAGGCTLGLDAATIRDAVDQVHNWPGLKLDLNRWIVDIDQKILTVDRVSKRASELKALLVQADGQPLPKA